MFMSYLLDFRTYLRTRIRSTLAIAASDKRCRNDVSFTSGQLVWPGATYTYTLCFVPCLYLALAFLIFEALPRKKWDLFETVS